MITLDSTVIDAAIDCDVIVLVRGEEVVVLRSFPGEIVESAPCRVEVEHGDNIMRYISKLTVDIEAPNITEVQHAD